MSTYCILIRLRHIYVNYSSYFIVRIQQFLSKPSDSVLFHETILKHVQDPISTAVNANPI